MDISKNGIHLSKSSTCPTLIILQVQAAVIQPKVCLLLTQQAFKTRKAPNLCGFKTWIYGLVIFQKETFCRTWNILYIILYIYIPVKWKVSFIYFQLFPGSCTYESCTSRGVNSLRLYSTTEGWHLNSEWMRFTLWDFIKQINSTDLNKQRSLSVFTHMEICKSKDVK